MRDGENKGSGESSSAPSAEVLLDRSLDTPNCPHCLTRMTIAESATGEPYWSCSTCGLAAIV